MLKRPRDLSSFPYEPEVDPRFTLRSPPGEIPFRLLAPVRCPRFVHRPGSLACLPRVREGALLMTCPSCDYTTKPSRWLLDHKAQGLILESIPEHLGRGTLIQMMAVLGAEADHELLNEPPAYDCPILARLSVALSKLEQLLWSVVGSIEPSEIVVLIRLYRDSLGDCYVLHDVTDFVLDLLRAPANEASPHVLEVIQRTEGNTEFDTFTRQMRAIVAAGYRKAEPNTGDDLVAAIEEWRHARLALYEACAYTLICNEFLGALVYGRFTDRRDQYTEALGKYVASNVRGFDC